MAGSSKFRLRITSSLFQKKNCADYKNHKWHPLNMQCFVFIKGNINYRPFEEQISILHGNVYIYIVRDGVHTQEFLLFTQELIHFTQEILPL